jgi:3-deoxy-D-manno-octulosonic-acid transferase
VGYYPEKLDRCIWVHAVSVGEVLASLPLIKALKGEYPDLPILVTTMTPTGFSQVKNALGKSVTHAYLPYDFPGAVKRFLKTFRPLIGLIMETELWPNLLAICEQRKIPLCLMNARLSKPSAKNYHTIAPLTRTMFKQLTRIAANGKKDALRFTVLGAPKEKVIVTGNIKFDLELPKNLHEDCESLRAKLGLHRFIWIAASTHEGEETLLLNVHQKICKENPNALLILVPRHPNRFESIAKLCKQSFTTIRRSENTDCSLETNVYLGDTMGELLLLYNVADVTVVGGSLVPHVGGHNMLEPALLRKPILTGTYLFNFAEISDNFVKARALIKVADEEKLAEHLLHLMTHPADRIQMGERALKVANANRGALNKQLEIVKTVMA